MTKLNIEVHGNPTLANEIIQQLSNGYHITNQLIPVLKQELKEIILEMSRNSIVYLNNSIFIDTTNDEYYLEIPMEYIDLKIIYISYTKIVKLTYDSDILEEFLMYQTLKNPDRVIESYWNFEDDLYFDYQ